MINVDNLISAAGSNGWDFFQQLFAGPTSTITGGAKGLGSSEAIAAAERRAYDWAAFYATDAGKRCIDHLVAETLERPNFTAHLGLPSEAAYGHGCFREGQNAIVFLLLKLIAQGSKEAAPPERTA